MALVLDTAFDTELTKKIDFKASYRCDLVDQESGEYIHHALTSLEIELTSRLDLDLSVVWDRIQAPKPDSTGQVPEQDDVYFFFGIDFEL